MEKKRIGVLVSGGGTNLQAIMDACANEDIHGEIVCVGSDNQEAKGLLRARKANIPDFTTNHNSLITLSRQSPGRLALSVPADFDEKDCLVKAGLLDNEKNRIKLRVRAAAEQELLLTLKKYRVDVLVLAGFMKLLSPYFLDRFQPSQFRPLVLNIHPSLLPSFPGTDGYGDAWKAGTRVHGSTVHFVDYGEDTGPIINQTNYRRYQDDTLETFQDRGLKLEWELYVDCLRLFCEDRLEVVMKDGHKFVTVLPDPQFKDS